VLKIFDYWPNNKKRKFDFSNKFKTFYVRDKRILLNCNVGFGLLLLESILLKTSENCW